MISFASFALSFIPAASCAEASMASHTEEKRFLTISAGLSTRACSHAFAELLAIDQGGSTCIDLIKTSRNLYIPFLGGVPIRRTVKTGN